MTNGAEVKKIDDFNADDRISVKLLENSIHFLNGDISEDNALECIKWITYENLDQRDRKKLTLYINSVGGDLYQAFAIIDVMKNSYHPVSVIGMGAVMSSAFLIFASGTKGERIASRNCSFMCHQYSETFTGKHHDLKATMKEGEMYNSKMIDVLQEATGLSRAKIRTKLLPASDVYLSAEEVVSLGAADQIM